MILSLGDHILGVPAALVLAAGALTAVRILKWNLLVIFGVGLGVWIDYLGLGGPVPI